MNIHFTNIELYENLRNSSLVEIEIGSGMYGLKNQNSDTDIMCIYATSESEKNSFSLSHHQLQYKDENNKIDYLFVNIHNFLRNCINGDSTINFEVINSKILLNTSLDFLYNLRKAFYNYKIMRSYLGMAKRDIQRLDIDAKNEYEKNKKVAHVYRGLTFAKKIYFGNDIEFSEDNINYIKYILWNIKGYEKRKDILDDFLNDINLFRNKINKDLDDKKLINFMSVENQVMLDYHLLKLINSNEYQNKKMKDFDMKMVYDANENGINY